MYEYIVLRRINARVFVVCLQHSTYYLGAACRNVVQRTYHVRQKWTQVRHHREPPLEGREPTWDVVSTQTVAGSWELSSWALNTARIIPLPPHCPRAHTTSTRLKPEFTPTPKTHITSPCPTPSPDHPRRNRSLHPVTREETEIYYCL